MENKKLGIILIIIGLFLGIFLYGIVTDLQEQNKNMQCTPSQECIPLEKNISYSHIGIGIVVAIITLGLYMLIFNKSSEIIFKRLEEEKSKQIKEERFTLILSLLDTNEQNVLTIIRDNPGITQNTLHIKASVSKAKLSQVLTNFEKKNLITKKVKGKTCEIYQKRDF